MSIRYNHLTNSLRCTSCGKDQELPGSYYGNPHVIMEAEESMQAMHTCNAKRMIWLTQKVSREKLKETYPDATIRTPRPAVLSARDRAKYVLGLVSIQ